MAATRAPTKTERDVHTDAWTARAETGATAAPMKAMMGSRRKEGGKGCVGGGGGGRGRVCVRRGGWEVARYGSGTKEEGECWAEAGMGSGSGGGGEADRSAGRVWGLGLRLASGGLPVHSVRGGGCPAQDSPEGGGRGRDRPRVSSAPAQWHATPRPAPDTTETPLAQQAREIPHSEVHGWWKSRQRRRATSPHCPPPLSHVVAAK